MKIELDWEKWFSKKSPDVRFSGSTDLPREVVKDEATGLQRYAVAKRGFEKYIKLMTEEQDKEEARERGLYWTTVSAERLSAQMLEGLRFILLDDEEIYKLNPEFYEEMGIVRRV